MIKIEAITLEEAYQNAASSLECSVTELRIEVVQSPSNGFLGLFKKSAIIVATKEIKESPKEEPVLPSVIKEEKKEEEKKEVVEKKEEVKAEPKVKQRTPSKKEDVKKTSSKSKNHTILNNTIMPESFVSMQDEDDDEEEDTLSYLADYDDDEESITHDMQSIATTVAKEINNLFDLTCFNIEKIDVKVFDENTLLIEFKGEDAALLIGKEGYRYKALSYMIFNWINSKYQVQLRLEIAEFLKNQEESVSRYLVGVCENVDRDGRAQTKILDGVLVQIALRELREKYNDKYVAIRSTRDGMKYIIINDYHSN